ncbi:hypothetical protein D9Q98_001494 [Chlorella vulgaris]|uniref:Uncharacterized protein n=1 Tax=Chlorella vulgaris TaxID=3077 RepID=A0A9D4U047_CHLVU|nr:hypothetical protein D9Q98_001494 [Chlorella vulgaris]
MPTGLRFTASLCKAAKDTRLLLIEVDSSITGREIRGRRGRRRWRGGRQSGSGDAEHASSRCKLGVLVQHALPRLAQRLGAYSQAKEKETGAGTACANPPPPDSAEEQALRRAKATLVEAARYCGAEAAARWSG